MDIIKTIKNIEFISGKYSICSVTKTDVLNERNEYLNFRQLDAYHHIFHSFACIDRKMHWL